MSGAMNSLPPPSSRRVRRGRLALLLGVALAGSAVATGAASAAPAATTGPDVIAGTSAEESVDARGGNDVVNGRGGDDALNGGAGRDTVSGGAGKDTVTGGVGADTLSGGPGADNVSGGPGPDTVAGGPGADALAGGPGADTITCGPGDTVYADGSDDLQGCAGATVISAPAYFQSSPMGVRLQWNANWGYCGETSFNMAGMLYGQYTSQWTARSVASSITDQTQQTSQLLLGPSPPDGNAVTAADAMQLEISTNFATGGSTSSFMAWIKQQFLAGDPVILGAYNNVNILGESGSGDPDYDHIVPVMGIGSQQPLSGSNASTYYSTDQITISDNGLFTPHPNSQPDVPGNTPNNPTGSALYTYQFGTWQKNRKQANRGWTVGDLYSVRSSAPDYAVAVTGVTDTSPGGPFTIPVSLSASVDNEGFQDEEYMSSPPAASPMTLTATVSIPDQTQAYNLYLYTDFANVPDGSFNTAATTSPADVAQTWSIPANSGSTYTVTLPSTTTTTGGTYVFRAVPTTAP